MDHSRLPGSLCLLLLLVCGCSDPGYELRRATYDGNAAVVEKILKAHPELVNAREKPMPVVVVAPFQLPTSFDSQQEAEVNVVEFCHAPPQDPISWRRVGGSMQVTTGPREFYYVV